MTSAKTSAMSSSSAAPGKCGLSSAAAAFTPVSAKLNTSVASASYSSDGGAIPRARYAPGSAAGSPGSASRDVQKTQAAPPVGALLAIRARGLLPAPAAMSRSASGALLAWTDKGGLSGSEKADMVRIALRLAGYEPRLAAGAKLSGGGHAALMEALLPEALRPGKRDCRLSLERCVSVMLGGGVPEDRILTAVVNKTNAAGVLTQNAWQARGCARRAAAGARPRAGAASGAEPFFRRTRVLPNAAAGGA